MATPARRAKVARRVITWLSPVLARWGAGGGTVVDADPGEAEGTVLGVAFAPVAAGEVAPGDGVLMGAGPT
jgi:hypothetical protein